MNNSEKTFVNRLKAWRARNFYSQQRAAALLGITRPYLSQIENGRDPSAELVNKFDELESTSSVQAGRVSETSPEYHGLLKKVIFIEEEGLPEQLEMVTAFLDTVCEKLGLPRAAPNSKRSTAQECRQEDKK